MTPTSACSLWYRSIWAVGVTALCLAIGYDLVAAPSTSPTGLPPALAELTGAVALLLPTRLRPAWLTPAVRACVPALLTAGTGFALWASGHTTNGAYKTGQFMVLLCLTVVALRRCVSTWAATTSAALLWSAMLTMQLAAGELPTDRTAENTLATLLTAGFAVIGGSLRAMDRQRREAVREVRRAERMEIAADLHDFVAHHVTGILVQTQMARMLATSATAPASDRAQLDPVLAGIEHSAIEALASMRRLVGVLRTDLGPAAVPAAVRPTGDLAQLVDLVADFSRVGRISAVLSQDPSVPDALPREVQTAAFRVVQEALTNVRRHAADADRVLVDLRHADGTLEVSVRDDGHGSAPPPHTARGGGFGLVGLAERVSALGGELTARPGARGWEVRARLPVSDRRGARVPVGMP